MLWIINYWKYLLVFLSLSVLSTSLVWMKISNIELEADNKVLNAKFLSITLQLERNSKDYETAMNEYTNNIQKIKTVYKDRIQTIYNIKGDDNANDCNDTAFVLNTIEY